MPTPLVDGSHRSASSGGLHLDVRNPQVLPCSGCRTAAADSHRFRLCNVSDMVSQMYSSSLRLCGVRQYPYRLWHVTFGIFRLIQQDTFANSVSCVGVWMCTYAYYVDVQSSYPRMSACLICQQVCMRVGK